MPTLNIRPILAQLLAYVLLQYLHILVIYVKKTLHCSEIIDKLPL